MWYTQKKLKKCRLSTRECIDLDILGITNMEHARSFNVIHILGVHFKAGEWGGTSCKSCGSVITTIYDGRSRYCIVDKFIQVQNNNSMGLVFTVLHFCGVGTTQMFCDGTMAFYS